MRSLRAAQLLIHVLTTPDPRTKQKQTGQHTKSPCASEGISRNKTSCELPRQASAVGTPNGPMSSAALSAPRGFARLRS
jgi:hypothetical protein